MWSKVSALTERLISHFDTDILVYSVCLLSSVSSNLYGGDLVLSYILSVADVMLSNDTNMNLKF